MSEYGDIIKRLEGKIARLNVLKDAQVEGDHRYETYQKRITEMTDLLNDFESNIPTLKRCDEKIKECEAELRWAIDARGQGAGLWPTTGAWSGGIGILGLLASVTIGLPLPVIALSIAAIGVAILCVYRTVDINRASESGITQAQRDLQDARAARAALENAKLETTLTEV